MTPDEVALRTPRVHLLSREPDARTWALRTQGDRWIGQASLLPAVDELDPAARIEVSLASSADGLGLEHEVVRGLVAHALLDLGLERVDAFTTPGSGDLPDAARAVGAGPPRWRFVQGALPPAASDWRRLGPPPTGPRPGPSRVGLVVDVLFEAVACAPPALMLWLVIVCLRLDASVGDALGPGTRYGLGFAAAFPAFVLLLGAVIALRHTRLGAAAGRARWPFGYLAREVRESPGWVLVGFSCVSTLCAPFAAGMLFALVSALASLRR